MDINWTEELVSQLEWHWQHQLRPRLDGLTDDEYFWAPVPDCWSVRPRAASKMAEPLGRGEFTLDFVYPGPEPAPVTTIAWRLAHIIVGVFAARNASHFGALAADWDSFDYAGTAKEALDQLDQQYATWIAGVRDLGIDGLAEPCGPSEGPFAEYPKAALVLHIHREVIHHGAEIALLRDLYEHKKELGHAV
jgi:DinB superfamily